jgi:phosphomannomutase
MLAVKKKKLSELIEEITNKYGSFYYKRIDKHLKDNSEKEVMINKARQLTEVAGLKVTGKDELDGCKLLFDEGWLLIRASGTEPLLRIYTETYSKDMTGEILNDITKKFNI